MRQLISQTKSNLYIGNSIYTFHQAIVYFFIGFERVLASVHLSWVFMRCLKISNFDDIVCKFRDRIVGWANRLLSLGEKLMLICHMLSFMSLHLFHVLRPFVVVVQCLERLMTWFLWGYIKARCQI